MSATFSRLKNWNAEILTNEDLNNEIDNILDNLGPDGIGDYSSNVAQMQTQTDPGTSGNESLATSLSGEIERLRYVIARLIGSDVDYWYETPSSTIFDLVSAIGTGLPDNRISSGLTTGNSSQLNALRADGADASLDLLGNSTSFVYYIEGTQYTIDSDVTISGLGLAPSSNNTCDVNDANLSGSAQFAKWLGQFGTTITVDSMGSEVSNLTGSIAAFKGATEYFLAYVKSSTELTVAFRGCFFDSNGDPVRAEALNDNDTLTLMRLAWIFADTDGGLKVTYNNPTVSASQPSSPATGDYWFDLSNDKWKTFNSTSWVDADATLVGISVQDDTNCVATRTFDSYLAADALNTLEIQRVSTSTAQVKDVEGQLQVFNSNLDFRNERLLWDMSSDLESGFTEAADTWYFFYITENGTPKISPTAPKIRHDLLGFYHPEETWRCLGFVYNDSGSDFRTYMHTFGELQDTSGIVGTMSGSNFDNPYGNAIGEEGNDPGPGGIAYSIGTGQNQTFSSTSYTDLDDGSTTLEAVLTTTGRPVHVQLIDDLNDSSSAIGRFNLFDNSSNDQSTLRFLLAMSFNGGAYGTVGELQFRTNGVSAANLIEFPPSTVSFVDPFLLTGVRTYKLQVLVQSGDNAAFWACRIMAREI